MAEDIVRHHGGRHSLEWKSGNVISHVPGSIPLNRTRPFPSRRPSCVVPSGSLIVYLSNIMGASSSSTSSTATQVLTWPVSFDAPRDAPEPTPPLASSPEL